MDWAQRATEVRKEVEAKIKQKYARTVEVYDENDPSLPPKIELRVPPEINGPWMEEVIEARANQALLEERIKWDREQQELAQQSYAEQAAQQEREYRQNVYRNKVESMANVGYQIPNTQENTADYFKSSDGKVDPDRLSLWKAHVEYVVNNDKSLDDKLSAVPKEQLNNIDFVTSYVVAHAWQSFQKVVGKPAKVQNLTEQTKVPITSTQGVGKVLPDAPLGRANPFNQRLDPSQPTTQNPRSFASFVQKAQGT
jgi:hypothetical protein